MATSYIRLEPPAAFDFKKPEEWPHWKQKFERFRLASGLSNDESKQVSTLLYCLGEEGEDVLLSARCDEKAKQKYSDVMGAFDTYFSVSRNIIFERARFNSRSQADGESVEQYIVALHSLARNCAFGQLTEELVRDRLVIGISDSKLSQRLQMDAELTLEKATKLVRQSEAVQAQQQIIKGPKAESVGAEVGQIKPMGEKEDRERCPL